MAEQFFEEVLVESMSEDEINDADYKKKLYEKFQDNDEQTDDKSTNPIQVQSPETSTASHQNNEDSEMPEINIEFVNITNSVSNDQNIPSTSSAAIKMEQKHEPENELELADSIDPFEYFTNTTENVEGDEKFEFVIEAPEAVEKDQTKNPFYCDLCSIDFTTIKYYERHFNTNKHFRAVGFAERGKRVNQKVKYVRKNPVKLPQNPKSDGTAKKVPAIKNKPAATNHQNVAENSKTKRGPVTKQKAAIEDHQDDHVVPQMNNNYAASTSSQSTSRQQLQMFNQNANLPSTSNQQSHMQLQTLSLPGTSSQWPQMHTQSLSLPDTSSQQPQFLSLPGTSSQWPVIQFAQMMAPNSIPVNQSLQPPVECLHNQQQIAPQQQQQQQFQELEPQHCCNLCDTTFKMKCHLIQHINANHTDRKFRCETCGKKFLSNEILKAHEFNHNDEKPHKCSRCTESFITETELRRHEEVHEPVIKNCIYCGSGYIQYANFERHMEIHLKKNDFLQYLND